MCAKPIVCPLLQALMTFFDIQGMEIIKLLGIKPGPITSVLLQKVIEWQLDHPDGSKEECGEYIKAEYEGGRIVPPPVVAKAGNKKGKQ